MAYKRTYNNNEATQGNSKNETVIELDKKKQVTIRKFNNINLVDIREFYIDKDTKEKKPGKKGISLTEDTWKRLLESASDIQNALDKLNGKESISEPMEKKQKLENSTEIQKEDKKEEGGEGDKENEKEKETESEEE